MRSNIISRFILFEILFNQLECGCMKIRAVTNEIFCSADCFIDKSHNQIQAITTLANWFPLRDVRWSLNISFLFFERPCRLLSKINWEALRVFSRRGTFNRFHQARFFTKIQNVITGFLNKFKVDTSMMKFIHGPNVTILVNWKLRRNHIVVTQSSWDFGLIISRSKYVLYKKATIKQGIAYISNKLYTNRTKTTRQDSNVKEVWADG